MSSKTKSVKKVRSTKTAKSDTKTINAKATAKRITKICTDYRAEWHKAGMARFAELIEKHGLENMIVFPMTDEETERIKLAAFVHEDTIHDYAKIAVIEMVRCDVEAFIHNLEHGKAKVVEGKAKR